MITNNVIPARLKSRKPKEIYTVWRGKKSLVSSQAYSMEQHEDILSEIAAILGDIDTTPESYDPERPGMEESQSGSPTAGAESIGTRLPAADSQNSACGRMHNIPVQPAESGKTCGLDGPAAAATAETPITAKKPTDVGASQGHGPRSLSASS